MVSCQWCKILDLWIRSNSRMQSPLHYEETRDSSNPAQGNRSLRFYLESIMQDNILVSYINDRKTMSSINKEPVTIKKKKIYQQLNPWCLAVVRGQWNGMKYTATCWFLKSFGKTIKIGNVSTPTEKIK